LSKTLDYKLTQILEEAELCDIVPVYYPQIGLTSEDAKLTTIVYDVLLEQNDSVEVGVIGDGFKSSMTSNLSGKIDDLASNQQRLVNTLPDYLLNAQGNKVWYNRPDNNEHKIGDIWFEKNGLYDRMYVWNGSQWEKRIDTEDVDKIKKEVDKQLEQAKQSTAIEIEKANAKAQEALIKAGTIPDTATLSDQIKTFILNSPDLNRKVTETFNNADNGDTIYSKIVSKVATNFVTTAEVNGVYDRVNNLSDKIAKQTVEFNKLTESNKLYERIIGTSETGAPDKLSRLVMSSQIFQTEVGKYSTTGGPNMLRNSRADDGLKYWSEANGRMSFTTHSYYLNGQKRIFLLSNGAVIKSPRFIFKKNAEYTLNLLAFDANTARFKITFCKRKKDSTNDYDEVQTIFDKTGSPAFSSHEAVKCSFKFNTGDFDNGYLSFEYTGNPNGWSGLFMTELDFYEGTADRKWQPAPEDSAEPIEAVRTQMTLLSNSWSVRNLNSAGDVLGQLNLNPDGSVRINEGLLSVGEKTIIKDGVIKKSMIGEAQIGTAHIEEIDASTARLINVSVKNIVADGLTANIIHGGVLASNNGKLKFDLNNSTLVSTTDESAIKRIGTGANFPTQFLKFSQGWVQGRSRPVGMTILGSNREGNGLTENGNSGGFAGIRIWNGANGEGFADSVDVVGDDVVLCDSPFDNRHGWGFSTIIPNKIYPLTNGYNSQIYTGNIYLIGKNGQNQGLRELLWQIGDNIAQLYRFRAQNNEGTPGWNDTNKWGWV
jgi:pblB